MMTTLLKLSFSDIRSRLLATILTVLLTGAAATTIVLTLEVGSTAREPWMKTFDAANGAHVLANVSSEADSWRFANLPGVVESDQPGRARSSGARGQKDRSPVSLYRDSSRR